MDWEHVHEKLHARSCDSPKSGRVVEVDDWVVVGDRLASVAKLGYDRYAGQVRIV